MAFIIVNEKYRPAKLKTESGFYLDGLRLETHEIGAEVFQHPVDNGKLNLTDGVLEKPRTYSAQLFVADNPQSYKEQFVAWGKALTGDNTKPYSEVIFDALKMLIGVVVDVDQSFAGTIEMMLITSVTASRGVTKGMNINIDLVEVQFADYSVEEGYAPVSETVKKKVVNKKDLGRPTDETLTDKQKSSTAYDIFVR